MTRDEQYKRYVFLNKLIRAAKKERDSLFSNVLHYEKYHCRGPKTLAPESVTCPKCVDYVRALRRVRNHRRGGK